MQYTVNLQPGQPWRQQTAGGYFLLMSITGAPSVQVRLVEAGGQELENVVTAGRGLKARMPQGKQFGAVEFTAAAACTVVFVISQGLVDIDIVDGAQVTATIAGLPLPVSNDRGAPGNPIYVNSAIAGAPAAGAIINDAPVAMSAVIGAIAAANANRLSLRMTNTGANPVALGAAGLTYANGAVILQPGDTWIEERAANLAWYGICNTGLASTIAIQEVTT